MGTPEVVQALQAVQRHARTIRDLRILATSHKVSLSAENFSAAQDASIALAVRKLKETWVQRTASAIRQALSTVDRAEYNVEEGTMGAYCSHKNKLFCLLKRINYTMTHDLFLVNTSVTVGRARSSEVVVISVRNGPNGGL